MKNILSSWNYLRSSFKDLYHNKNSRLLPELQLTLEEKKNIYLSLPGEILKKLPEDIIQLLIEGIHYYNIFKKYRYTHQEYRTKEILSSLSEMELAETMVLSNDFFSFFRKELHTIGMTPDKIKEVDCGTSWQYWPNGCRFARFEIIETQLPYELFYNDPEPDNQYIYNSIWFSMSTGINYYSLSFSNYSLNKRKLYTNYLGENDEEKKWVQWVEKIMTRIWYKRISPELLNLVLPVQWELYSSLPNLEEGIDLSWEEASGPYILQYLLFGE